MTRIAIYKDPCGIVWQLEKNGDKQPDIQERAGGGWGGRKRSSEEEWEKKLNEIFQETLQGILMDSWGLYGGGKELWRPREQKER